MIGKRFTKLLVIKYLGRKGGHRMWLCQCDCGKEKAIRESHLLSSNTKSCGCLRSQKHYIHGDASRNHTERLYAVWRGMRYRCRNPNSKDYANYGGRGICVCSEWDSYMNFKKWALTNGYHEGLQIDRRNNDKGYSPENCRWVTCKDNQRSRRNNRIITIDGKTQTATEWAIEKGIEVSKYFTLLRKSAYNGNQAES